MRRHISQREAHKLQRLLKSTDHQLAALRNRWGSEPGKQICSVGLSNLPAHVKAIKVATLLDHVVIARVSGDDVNFYAVPLK